jgi:hypothetical protein
MTQKLNFVLHILELHLQPFVVHSDGDLEEAPFIQIVSRVMVQRSRLGSGLSLLF